jgi:flagellar capping protein FliD
MNVGFDKGVPLRKEGYMLLTVGENLRKISINYNDTVEQITTKINHTLSTARDEFEAFLIEGNDNTAFIEVRAKNTGNGIIRANFYNEMDNPGLFNGDLSLQSNTDGINAIAYINGIRREQSSNEFLNVVEGLSFDLSGRKNTANVAPANGIYGGLNYSTIKVKADNANIKKMIVEFGNSVNQLSYIVAKNNQSVRSVNKDKYADPTTLMSSYDSSDSPLRGSSLMIEASEIWERFTTTKLGKEGDIQSIYELGMGLKKCHKDGVEYEEVYFEDESVFTKKFKDDFESICKFFITDVKITPTPGNLSTIQYLPGEFDKQIIDRAIVGKDILTETTFGLDGKVTRFTAIVNGEVIIAHSIVHNEGTGRFNVSFEDPDKKQESILRGLELRLRYKSKTYRKGQS